jgi:hypothetical protein
MPQIQRPNPRVTIKPTATLGGDTPLKVMECAYLWFNATARRYQAQLEALPENAKSSAQRARLERMVSGYYLRAVNVASKAAPFCNARLTTHQITPQPRTDAPYILWRRENESIDDLLERTRKETGWIIKRNAQSLPTEDNAVVIMDESDRTL